jgi:hypothetical protein
MRRLLVLLGSLSILSSLVVFVGGGTASAMPLGVGFGSCKFSAGKGTFSPKLTPAGSASVTAVKIKFNVSLSKDCGSVVTSPSGDTINALTSVVGSGTYNAGAFANKCGNFETIDTATVKVKTTWHAVPTAIAPSVSTYTALAGTVAAGPPVVITLNGPPGSAVTGSFSSPTNTGTKIVLTTSIPACPANVAAFKITGSYTELSN